MRRTLSTLQLTFLISIIAYGGPQTLKKTQSQAFEFTFENKTLRGSIERPNHQKSSAVVLIIPGYGKTNFMGGSYSKLRTRLVKSGLTVVFWDKMGCGNSEGEFDAQQPVENSALEAVAAIRKIREIKEEGSDKIGCWGISRAGWIVPLINEIYPIDFWISVSGTDDKENFGYLLKSNLIIEGKEEAEAERLYTAWKLGHRIFCTQGAIEDYQRAIQPLKTDSLCRKLFGYTTSTEITEEDRNDFLGAQKKFMSKGHFDDLSGLWVYINDFDKALSKINCPVLAMFGANDSQVDWRKTRELYNKTIGGNKNSELTVQVFEDCNHVLQKCITCGWKEDLSALNWQACDQYYETMESWLREYHIVE